jgi:hypothetical protein
MIKRIRQKIEDWKKEKAYKKKIEELKKRDPFIYKNF